MQNQIGEFARDVPLSLGEYPERKTMNTSVQGPIMKKGGQPTKTMNSMRNEVKNKVMSINGNTKRKGIMPP